MNPVVGWSLAAAAVAAGWFGYGWRGVALAVSVVAFWLLLQFSRMLRLMRAAAGRPLGLVDSAVMLQSKLAPGMRMLQVVALTGSLGRKLGDDPECFAWHDAGGDRVRLEFSAGRLARWQLERAAADAGS